MKYIKFMILALIVPNMAQAVTMKNGWTARQSRINEVWPGLEEIHKNTAPSEFSNLREGIKKCFLGSHNPCNLNEYQKIKWQAYRPINNKIMGDLDRLGITTNGSIDAETQSIILTATSHRSTNGDKLTYPVTWYHKILGHLFSVFIEN